MTLELNDGLGAPADAAGTWERAAWQLGVDVAGPASDDVDRHARFPREAVDAMKEGRFFSALLPAEVGGGGATLPQIVGAVRALAAHCASSSLVLAMHSIEAFNLVRHGTTPALQSLLGEIARDQLVIANANSEVGVGGDVSRSVCAIDVTGEQWTLEKQALAISYGEYADLLMITARRDEDASETDQAFIVARKRDVTLEPTSEWDTLGLRGTCSRGFQINVNVDRDTILPVPFATVANDGGGQARQLLLSAVWVGLAEAAAAKAHDFVRAAARKSIGTTPPGALRVAEISAELLESRSLLASLAGRFEWLEQSSDLEDAGYTMALRNLKVSTSSLAVQAATGALGVCGIMGYKRDSPFSLDRIIRDAHGGLIMVSNDRILGDNAQFLLVRTRI